MDIDERAKTINEIVRGVKSGSDGFSPKYEGPFNDGLREAYKNGGEDGLRAFLIDIASSKRWEDCIDWRERIKNPDVEGMTGSEYSHAIRSLGMLGGGGVFETLAKALMREEFQSKACNEVVRKEQMNETVRAMGELRDIRAVEIFCRLAKAYSASGICSSALRALGKLGREEDIPFVEGFLDCESGGDSERGLIRFSALHSIAVIGGEAADAIFRKKVIEKGGNSLLEIMLKGSFWVGEDDMCVVARAIGRTGKQGVGLLHEYGERGFGSNRVRHIQAVWRLIDEIKEESEKACGSNPAEVRRAFGARPEQNENGKTNGVTGPASTSSRTPRILA